MGDTMTMCRTLPGMMKTARALLLTTAVGLSVPAAAVYTANMIGVVTDVLTYTESDIVLFRLSNQPTTHPACNPQYFSFDQTLPESRRKQLFARLLAAKESGNALNVGYDNSGDCSNTYIRVHRIG